MSGSESISDLKSWLQVQIQLPVFEADLLKDGCLKFVKRIEQLDQVAKLTQPEPNSSYIAGCSYRITKGLHSVIRESVKNLQAIDKELSGQFIAKFPKFARKLRKMTDEEMEVFLDNTDTDEHANESDNPVPVSSTTALTSPLGLGQTNSNSDSDGSDDSGKTSFMDINANLGKKIIKKEKEAQSSENGKKKTTKEDTESENGSQASHNRSVHSKSTEMTTGGNPSSVLASQEDLFAPDPDEELGSPAETVLIERSAPGHKSHAEISKEVERTVIKKEWDVGKAGEVETSGASNGNFSDSDAETVFNPFAEPPSTSTGPRLSLSRSRPPAPLEKSKSLDAGTSSPSKKKVSTSPADVEKSRQPPSTSASTAIGPTPVRTHGPTTKRKLEFSSPPSNPDEAVISDEEPLWTGNGNSKPRKADQDKDKDRAEVLNDWNSSDDEARSSDANEKEENRSPRRKKFRKSIPRRSLSSSLTGLRNCKKLKMKTLVTVDPLDSVIVEELNTKKKIQLGLPQSKEECGDDLNELDKAIQCLTSFDPLKKTHVGNVKHQRRKPGPKSKMPFESLSQTRDNLLGQGVFTSSDEDSDATVALSKRKVVKTEKTVPALLEVDDESGMSTTENNDNEDLQSDLNYSTYSDGDNLARQAVLATESSDNENNTKKTKIAASQRPKGKYLTPKVNISSDDDTDSDFAESSTAKKRKPLKPKTQNKSQRPVTIKREVSMEPDSDPDFKDVPTPSQNKKRPPKLPKPSSDSDELLSLSDKEKSDGSSDDDFVQKSRIRKKKRVISSSSDETKASKPKKKSRQSFLDSSSGSDSDIQIIEPSGSDTDIEEILDHEPEPAAAAESPVKKKKIRPVMDDSELQKATRQAGKEEEERKKRILEKQRAFNELFITPEFESVDCLVLDYDPKTKTPLISVDKQLANKLKPHQCQGVQFMFDACFETVEKKGAGGGCILAHCMGLGKTLQTITFLHTVMAHERMGVKRALVICPLNTVGNWYSEFKQWLKDVQKKITVHKLYESTGRNRVNALEAWKRTGGVGIIHYDSFRVLGNAVYPPPPKETRGGKQPAKPKKPPLPKFNKRELDIIREILLDPGPDIVVCDEGHLLKNATSKLTHSVSNFGTKRRIVLTGTPLQNNLMEYHTMMAFVKPNLLGNRKEFGNQFSNPIKEGQHKDSTDWAVKVMKRRAHVLHKLLEGCVQRMDYTVLTPFLPPKFEYSISVSMTALQKEMYLYYLDTFCQGAMEVGTFKTSRLFKDYSNLYKVWTHPKICTYKTKSKDDGGEDYDSAGSLKDFIVDDLEEDAAAEDSDCIISDAENVSVLPGKKKKKNTKKGKGRSSPDELVEDRIPRDWYKRFFPDPSELDKIEISGKMIVLMEILKTCESIGDKILIFSQRLGSLDLIEECLDVIDRKTERASFNSSFGTTSTTFPMIPDSSARIGRWRRGIEYFRIDGTTKTEERKSLCDRFNAKNGCRAKLFLISTKAGGLGINLIGANRVVIFDASWNPSQDLQSIFRVYRFGQVKPCYIYRLLSRGTMEEKIYNRQVVKLSLSSRVVDEHQIERHFHFDDIQKFYTFDPNDNMERPVPAVPKDRLLADLLTEQKDHIFSYLEHDSLLVNQIDEGLTEEERKAAWEEYNNKNDKEKGGPGPSSVASLVNINDPWIERHCKLIKQSHPTLSDTEVLNMTVAASLEIKQMMLEWDLLHDPSISPIQKLAIKVRFDKLMDNLNYKFGRDAVSWDGVLNQYQNRQTLPMRASNNLIGSALHRMNAAAAAATASGSIGQGPSGTRY